jgi:endoglucanase
MALSPPSSSSTTGVIQVLRSQSLFYSFPLVGVLLGVLLAAAPAGEPKRDAFYYNRLLGRGINLGNAFEGPSDYVRSLRLKASYFRTIKEAGFNSIRIPVRWSVHAADAPPFSIDSAFFKRIDWVVEQALSHGLIAVINVHHYDEMNQEPANQLPRLKALWRQIANRYQNRSERLYFELLNEPRDELVDERWQETVAELLRVIRESNPTRAVIVATSPWNGLDYLTKLKLPERDRRLIVSFHYYDPFRFTHQGAEWVTGSNDWKGTTWEGTAEQQDKLENDFDRAARWSEQSKRPLYLGEFGAFGAADMASRARWTRTVAREAERRGFSWSYWEFFSGFGAYNMKAKAWREPLLRALMGGP